MNGKKIAALTVLTVTALFVMAAVIAEPADSAPAPVEDSWYSAGDGLFVVKYSSPLDGYYTCTVESASGTVHAASYADLTGQTTIALTVDDGKSVGAGEYTVSIVGAAGSHSETVTVYEVELGDHVSAKLNGEGDDITASVLLGKNDFVTVAFDTGYELDEAAGMTVTDSKYGADPTADAHSITAKATEYDVAFDIGDSQWKEGFDVPEKYTYGVPLTLPAAADLSIYIKTGYAVAFVGWYAEGDTEETIVTEITAGTTGEMSFVAKYAETPNTYTVVFDSNTGTGEMSDQVFTYDVQQAIAANTFSKTGHTFAGWNTAADGSGTPYADGAAVSNLAAEGTVTLYAQWTVNSYKLTVNYTGYSEAIPSHEEDVVYDTAYSVVSPVKTGYTADILTVSGTMPAEAVTVTVTYTINTYIITWKNNDGSTIDTTEVNYGAVPAHADASKEATAQYTYTFSGWDPAPVAATQATTYTAVFDATVNKYTVTIAVDGQGSVSQASVQNVPYGSVFSIDGNVLTINEVAVTATSAQATAQYTYAFDSWSIQSGTAIAGDITVTAKFSATVNRYAVSFTAADHTAFTDKTGIGADGKVVYGESFTFKVSADAGYTEHLAVKKDGNAIVPDAYGVYTVAGVSAAVSITTETAVSTFQVLWKNYDGTVLETDAAVPYGTVPAYDGAVPVRAADAQYTYAFSGWNPTPAAIYADAVYDAQFSTTLNKYTVVWTNYDDTVLETDEGVDYGTMPIYNGTMPTKPGDGHYDYTFDKWTPDVAAVTGGCTYKAQFSSDLTRFTVTFAAADHTAFTDKTGIDTDGKVVYGGSFTFKVSADAGYSDNLKVFNGSAELVPVDGIYTVSDVVSALTITSSTSISKYAVTWKNYDGSVLASDEVDYGATPVYGGQTPVRTADAQYTYTFSGWNPVPAALSADAEYVAQFSTSVNKYTVTVVMDGSGTVSSGTVTQVPYGSVFSVDGNVLTINEVAVTATPAQATAQYTYAFDSWSVQTGIAIAGDITVTAKFSATVNKYTVTVVTDGQGSVSQASVQNVPYGSVFSIDGNVLTINEVAVTATPAQATAQYTYAFDSWSIQSGTAIAGDITVTAKFTASLNTYPIVWKNYDGSVLKTDASVAFGTVPVYTGTEPTREGDAQYSYTFSGWDPEVVAVSGDAEYTATFNRSTNSYVIAVPVVSNGTITVTGGDVVDGKVTVPYGTELTFTFSSDEGYYVTKWNGQDSFRINTFSVTVNGQLDVSCEISNLYKVSATVIGNGGVSGTGDYAYGTTAKLTAEPAEGSEFVSWSDGSTDASISVNVDSDIALTATFRPVAKTYEVTFRASDSTLATVSLESAIVTDGTPFSVEDGVLVIGDVRVSVTLSAPAPAYVNVFDGWDQESGTVTSAMTFTAKVRATTYYDKTDIFAEDGTKLSGAVFRFDAVFSTSKVDFNMDIWAGVNWDKHPSKNYSYLQYELKITSETGNPYVLTDGSKMTVSLFIGAEYEGLHVYSYHYSNTVGLESFDEQVVTDGAITMEVSDLSPFLVTVPRDDPEEHLDMSIVFIGVAAVVGVAVVGLFLRRL